MEQYQSASRKVLRLYFGFKVNIEILTRYRYSGRGSYRAYCSLFQQKNLAVDMPLEASASSISVSDKEIKEEFLTGEYEYTF